MIHVAPTINDYERKEWVAYFLEQDRFIVGLPFRITRDIIQATCLDKNTTFIILGPLDPVIKKPSYEFAGDDRLWEVDKRKPIERKPFKPYAAQRDEKGKLREVKL